MTLEQAKEKLAKYLNAQRQMPHIVSRGANKNMMAFAERIAVEYAQKPENFNEFFFKKSVVCAIICIIATLLILFIIPSKYNLLKKNILSEQENVACEGTELPAQTEINDKNAALEHLSHVNDIHKRNSVLSIAHNFSICL